MKRCAWRGVSMVACPAGRAYGNELRECITCSGWFYDIDSDGACGVLTLVAFGAGHDPLRLGY